MKRNLTQNQKHQPAGGARGKLGGSPKPEESGEHKYVNTI